MSEPGRYAKLAEQHNTAIQQDDAKRQAEQAEYAAKRSHELQDSDEFLKTRVLSELQQAKQELSSGNMILDIDASHDGRFMFDVTFQVTQGHTSSRKYTLIPSEGSLSISAKTFHKNSPIDISRGEDIGKALSVSKYEDLTEAKMLTLIELAIAELKSKR